MSDKKCMASQNGVCRNVYANGIKCSGYSKECKLRPAYNNIQNAAEHYVKSIRRCFGIVGDGE